MGKDRPEGAERYVDGLYYKIGVHGYVFVWMVTQWVKSTKTIKDLDIKERKEEKNIHWQQVRSDMSRKRRLKIAEKKAEATA